MTRAGLAGLLMLLAGPAAAVDLQLPATARQTVERNTSPDIYAAPIGVFDGQDVPTLAIEGAVRRASWRIASPGLTPLQVMQPLRAQLADAGYDIVLDCASSTCGGFDFRFATEVLPGPNMYVNLRAFHFVTALNRKGGTTDVITVLTSTAATSAYVQIIQAGGAEEQQIEVAATGRLPVTTQPVAADDLVTGLLAKGHAVLADLDFDTGSTDLGAGPFGSLQTLAGFLNTRPKLRVALVGHTDTVGGLQGNIAISRERARSVRARLISQYAIDADRLDAEGMGYLAPRASNLDAAGRDANRRVEVVLLSE